MVEICNGFSGHGYVVKVNTSKLRGILNYIVDDHPITFGSHGCKYMDIRELRSLPIGSQLGVTINSATTVVT